MLKEIADCKIFDLFKKRATCRSFRPDPIPEAVMDKLLNVACSSATSSGFQRISIIVVKDEEKKKHLAKLSRGQKFLIKAPVHLVFCVDHRRMRRIAEYEASPYDRGNSITSLWMGIVDATIAAQSIALAAEGLGLRSCFNGNILDMPREMAQLLQLPEGVVPAIMLTVGYPVSSEGRLSKKYPTRIMVHEETYCDLSFDELYAEHERKFPESYHSNNPRRERLYRAALSQGGEQFAARCLKKVQEAEKLTAYQYWFGCYYYDEDRKLIEAREYLDYLAENGFDITGGKL